MPATGYSPISLYYSSTAGNTPTAGNLVAGELAINIADGKLFYKDPSNVVQTLVTQGQSAFPSGTKMLFAQTAAPTGWTKDTTNYNEHALRVVTGTASSGGSVNFTTAFASQTPSGSVSSSGSSGNTTATGNISSSTSIGNTSATGNVSLSGGSISSTTLSTSQLASHNHLQTGQQGVVAGGNTGGTAANLATPGPSYRYYSGNGDAGGGTGHTHTLTNPTASFTGTAHNHNASTSSTLSMNAHNHTVSVSSSFTGNAINLAVKYLDVILATKD